MIVEFTDHFWDKWEERKEDMQSVGITIDKILEYTLNPDLVIDDPKRCWRKWHLKRVGERCLKIVVEPCGNKLIVVTAHLDRTLKRRRLCE